MTGTGYHVQPHCVLLITPVTICFYRQKSFTFPITSQKGVFVVSYGRNDVVHSFDVQRHIQNFPECVSNKIYVYLCYYFLLLFTSK